MESAGETIESRPPRAEIRGPEADSLDQDLWQVWSSTAKSFPEGDAVVSMWQRQKCIMGTKISQVDSGTVEDKTGYLRWSYKDLHTEATRLGNWLRHLGCGPGMRLAAILWNSVEWAAFAWSATKLGMVFIPLDPRSLDGLPSLLARIDVHVLVVQDEKIANSIDGLKIDSMSSIRRLQCSGPKASGWLCVGEIPSDDSGLRRALEAQVAQYIDREPNEQVAMMILSSGTTGEPKVCEHTHKNLMSQACEYDPKPGGPQDRWLVHTPASHIFAINNVLRAWKEGGTVVFPAHTFKVEATWKALTQEKCTIMSATPTLIKSLLSYPEFSKTADLKLDLVTMGGTTISAEDMHLCRDVLGAKHVIQAYGMTEGAPLISWKRRDSLLISGWHPGVGRILPGAAARICHPGNHDVLAIGEVGELYVSGTSVATGYHGEDSTSAFHKDKDIRWFNTGDQAMIDADGILHLLGRYKDLIIRGGENIQPARIERVLAEIPGLQAAVVGVPDTHAGQVPVAIVELPPGVDKATVASKPLVLGPMFALGAIYSLEELGLEAFPLTSLGKIRKGRLTDIIVKHREDMFDSTTDRVVEGPYESLSKSLTEAWERVTAITPQRDQDILYVADSISMLRFCDTVVRLTGRHVYLNDLIKHNTVNKLARFLVDRDDNGGQVESTSEITALSSIPDASNHPPTPIDLLPAETRDPTSLHPTSSFPDVVPADSSTSAAALALRGLGLPELEAIVPIRSALRRFVTGQRPHSFNIAFTFRAPGTTNSQVRRAISQLIRQHPLLRSVVLRAAGQEFHVVPAFDEGIAQKVISEFEVETVDEAIQNAEQFSGSVWSSPFMLRVKLVSCKADNLTYISLVFNHSILDALAIVPWVRNLDLLLQDEQVQLPRMTPYKLFADLHEQYSGVPKARAAVAFHAKRLRGISLLARALWPKQKAPGWMISDDAGSSDQEKRQAIRHEIWGGRWNSVKSRSEEPRISRIVHLPLLDQLVKDFGIPPAIFAKAAITLLNIIQTGSSHAIFTSWESSRSWPFLPNWIETRLPSAMSIDGPTLGWILNMTEVIASEPLEVFLKRTGKEHELATQHVHAPWSEVSRELQEEGHVATDASFRQGFVWDVSLLGATGPGGYLTDFKVLEPVNRHNWSDCGLFWNAYMADPQSIYFIATWDTAQMNDHEVNGYCDMLAEIMRRLANRDCRSKQIGEVFQANSF